MATLGKIIPDPNIGSDGYAFCGFNFKGHVKRNIAIATIPMVNN